ncbi:DUF2490 domain-containing protein [Chitinophagales bacterium]|nr:DUF2490 domain-containing protein [Chitinophagales bacterium]
MKKILILLLLAFCANQSFSQVQSGLWSGITVEKKINKQFEFKFEEEIRLKDNLSKLNSLLTETGFTYKPNKFYRLGLIYRFTYYTNGSFGNRLALSNQFCYKIEDITLSYRFNVQQDFNSKDPIEYKIRNKLRVDYKFNKHWEIGIGGELFYSFYYNRNILDRYRLSFGANHSLNKHHRVGASIMFQQEINTANPDTDVVFGIKYKYSF